MVQIRGNQRCCFAVVQWSFRKVLNAIPGEFGQQRTDWRSQVSQRAELNLLGVMEKLGG
jgi:hypothetical protein